MATLDEIKEVLTILTAAYPRYTLKAGTVRVYAAGLKDLPAEALQLGASQIITASKWFPAVSELRDAALEFADRRVMQEAEDRKAAWMLLNSWGCCHKCWTRPCHCDRVLETEAADVPQLEGVTNEHVMANALGSASILS